MVIVIICGEPGPRRLLIYIVFMGASHIGAMLIGISHQLFASGLSANLSLYNIPMSVY